MVSWIKNVSLVWFSLSFIYGGLMMSSAGVRRLAFERDESDMVELWADKVIDVSSEYDKERFGAKRSLGPSDVYPRYGDAGAWAQATADRNNAQYIEVGFAEALFVRKVEIYETYFAGGVRNISTRTPDNQRHTLYYNDAVSKIDHGRNFSPPITIPNFLVDTLRIDVDCTGGGVPHFVEIDAIKIHGLREIMQLWADKVIRVSSEFSDKERFGAQRALGPPVVYPDYGDKEGTWAQEKNSGDNSQYLEVGFAEALHLQKVDIYETFNAGRVRKLSARNADNESQTLYEVDEVTVIESSRIFSPKITIPLFLVDAVSIDVEYTANNFVEIDAIKIYGLKEMVPLFADKVIRVSSEYSVNYLAEKVLGAPDFYPSYGDSQNSWAQSVLNETQFIEVGFSEALFLQYVNIYETYNAGGVRKISARTTDNKWQTLYQNDTVTVIEDSRIFSPRIYIIQCLVDSLLIEVDCTVANGYVEIDAIMIYGLRDCGNGKWGSCCNSCGNCSDGNQCNVTTGNCPLNENSVRCTAGFKGDKCDQVCSPGEYGPDCVRVCGHCAGVPATCSPISGLCSTGCLPGYKGAVCKTSCSSGEFGADCKERCGHCSRGPGECSRTNGNCAGSPPCSSGYQGELCTTECDKGTFGIGCLETCGMCANGTDQCNITDGICPAFVPKCAAGFKDNRCKSKIAPQTSERGPGAAEGGAVGGVLALAVAGVVIFFLVRLRMHSRKQSREPANELNSVVEHDRGIVSRPSRQQSRDTEYYNVVSLREGPSSISVDELEEHVRAKRATEGITKEYENLPNGLQANIEVAKKSGNKGKSRYHNIVAYDHSRVVLDLLDGDPNSDYINACYIQGYKEENKYVALQGPTPIIIDDFWRTIWEVGTWKIVMLTNLVEDTKNKCEQYWPSAVSETVGFGLILVKLLEEDVYADFTFRILQATNKKYPGQRKNITQFHFIAWPDHGVPTQPTGLLNFLEKTYKRKRAFIITQTPLPLTVIDFWRLIHEQDVRTVVMLNNGENAGEDSAGKYWPDDSRQYGPFDVQTLETVDGDFSVTRIFQLKYKKEIDKERANIKQFQFTFWPDGETVPGSCASLIPLIEEVVRWQQQSGKGPIIVHCLDGATKSGLYCAISSIIERLKVDQEVDILQTIKQMRINRPEIVCNMDQFQFIHEVVLEYLDSFQTYANFQ